MFTEARIMLIYSKLITDFPYYTRLMGVDEQQLFLRQFFLSLPIFPIILVE